VTRAIDSSGVVFISVMSNPSSKQPLIRNLILSGLVVLGHTCSTHKKLTSWQAADRREAAC
jgi:hypothetical protein